MGMTEYLNVKDFTYSEYCDYLQNKYGIGICDYMTKSFYDKRKCKRTKEGLLAHHKMEDTMIKLSTRIYAMQCPWEWQSKENIVYCDYLEHLLLHILICKYPAENRMSKNVGVGGVINFIVPELNDVYSGWQTKQPWRKNCHDKVINDKNVYLEMLKQFIDYYKGLFDFELCHTISVKCNEKTINGGNVDWKKVKEFIENIQEQINSILRKYLCTSMNEGFNSWTTKNNSKLFKEIKALIVSNNKTESILEFIKSSV